MKYYAALAMISAKRKLNPNKRKHCFEIFGYDYIIDSDFNVWLIEINTNPCIEESSSLLKVLLPRMLDDAFKLTIDQLFPLPNNIDETKKVDLNHSNSKTKRVKRNDSMEAFKQHETFKVTGYKDDENMW
jgi:hypothetical protein